MSIPISIKNPDKIVLVYGDREVELALSNDFELIVFYTDKATAQRLGKSGLLADKKHKGGCYAKHPLEK